MRTSRSEQPCFVDIQKSTSENKTCYDDVHCYADVEYSAGLVPRHSASSQGLFSGTRGCPILSYAAGAVRWRLAELYYPHAPRCGAEEHAAFAVVLAVRLQLMITNAVRTICHASGEQGNKGCCGRDQELGTQGHLQTNLAWQNRTAELPVSMKNNEKDSHDDA